jgi:uncharacterized protein YjbI with pentapeptide repeats
MSEHDQTIARINALTSNARNTWFALLSALLFVGVTLMGVEHIDFYGVDRATQLPLINVSVPTPLFFYAAPLLTAAIYGYFHLYLIRLWDALGSAPARMNGDRLGDAIAPWLVTDAALHLRGWLRQDECTRPRAFEWASMLLNILLAWGLGLVVLGGTWWLSMPARDWMMTTIAGASLLAACFSGFASLTMFFRRMRSDNLPDAHNLWSSATVKRTMLIPIVSIVALGLLRTCGTIETLVPLDLNGEEIVEKPATWLPEEIARKDFLAIWCKREAKACEADPDKPEGFAEEWKTRRDAQISALKKPDWSRPQSTRVLDLRNANLQGSFLVGASLENARLQSAGLSLAQLQGASLPSAQLIGSDLRWAQLQGANLFGAEMQWTDLRKAQLQGADLENAMLQSANMERAQLQGANLRRALMQGADLFGARLKGVNLEWAQLQEADLKFAHLQDANLVLAELQGAELFRAQLQRADLERVNLRGANLERALLSASLLTSGKGQPNLENTNISASTNNGGALQFVDLTVAIFDEKTDWRNIFLDASVSMTDTFRQQMGGFCQQVPALLSPDDFYAHWRGWLEAAPEGFEYEWAEIAPDGYHNIAPIAPPEGCHWKTGPMKPVSE